MLTIVHATVIFHRGRFVAGQKVVLIIVVQHVLRGRVDGTTSPKDGELGNGTQVVQGHFHVGSRYRHGVPDLTLDRVQPIVGRLDLSFTRHGLIKDDL